MSEKTKAHVSEYSLEKTIRSCHVTKELLLQLENYLVNATPAILGMDKKDTESSYSVTITDDLGTETITHISNYVTSMFPNSTSSIALGYNVCFGTESNQVFVKFDKRKMFADIKVRYRSVNAREKATGVYAAICRIIDTQKTINHIFHPPIIIGALLSIARWMTVGFCLFSFMTKNYTAALLGLLAWLLLGSYWLMSSWLKPYISF